MRAWQKIAPGDLLDVNITRFQFSGLDVTKNMITIDNKGRSGLMGSIIGCCIVISRHDKTGRSYMGDEITSFNYVVHPEGIGWVRQENESMDAIVQRPGEMIESSI